MAVAAENFELSSPELFDWEFAEAQFSYVTDSTTEHIYCFRPPESEIYGRSLSTIHRLGAFMIHNTLQEAIHSPEAAQAKVEFYTSVEEGFGTDMELGGGLEVRVFDRRPVIGGRVIAKDLKTAVSDMTYAGLVCAEATAKVDARFHPQLVRSKWDHENALIVDKMARKETGYNTRIVISPFPEEAAAESGNEYWRNIGYVPHLKRGFVQLYHVAGDEIIAGSLSFDGCNKQQLHEIFKQFGVEISPDERTDNWLKYAITGNFSEEEAMSLAMVIADTAETFKAKNKDSKTKEVTNTVDVTELYKPVMERVFNECYVHVCESLARGYQTQGVRELIFQLSDKAQHFNERYANALYNMRSSGEQFTSDDSVVLHELLVYSTIEMMRALHLDKARQERELTHNNADLISSAYLQAADAIAFQSMLGGFGADGARANRTYSACGIAISLGEKGNSPENNPQTAYGGIDAAKGEESSGKKWMSCPYCGARVFDDPCAKVLSCWDCNALVVNGKIKSKGNGGSKARQARRKAEEAKKREAEIAKLVDEAYAERGIDEKVFEQNSQEPQSVKPGISQPVGV